MTGQDRISIPSLVGGTTPLDFAMSEVDRQTLGMVGAALSQQRVLLAYQPVVLARNPKLRLAINMSARSVGYTRWMTILAQGLNASPTLGERLILEITESSAMLVPELVIAFMAELQRKGIAFALDDFGAGYTAFRYLKDFFFDIIKIDGQFIRGIHRDPDNQVMTQALLSIGRHFDMFTVAEAVETPEEAEWLRRAGIDCLQGYLFGAPMVRPTWDEEARRKSA